MYLLFSVACNRNDPIQKENYIGKEIIFPDSLFLIKKDTLILTDESFYLTDNIKIVSITKADCGKCVIHFNKLNSFFRELEGNFDCFFIMSTDNFRFFESHVYPQLDKSFNIILNKNNCFEKSNKLEGTYNVFNTFILNNKNEIKFIGDPLYNKYNRNEYLNIIALGNE